MFAKKQLFGFAASAALISCALLLGSCRRSRTPLADNGRVTIEYWEKWTGFEADAMKKIVDKYNASQNRVKVNYLSTSQIEQKLLLATAGGNPPDVAGLFDSNVVVYAEKGALTPLDRLMKRDGVSIDSYLPSIANLCTDKGKVWGLPSTPSSLALHYNTRLFREAGLDPARPPRTIAELDDYARKLTRRDKDGKILQLGFSPMDPGWWNPLWVYWFDGELWKDGKTITITSPECMRCFEWIQSLPKLYGADKMAGFQQAAGQFASSQNPFICGKIAMQLQGVYMYNFISKYNPQLEWAVAPFPSVSAEKKDVTLVQCDVLAIPKGAKHLEQAWEFIKFVQKQENLEELCLAQKKFSPLKNTSPEFYSKHPNPNIRLFRKLAESPNAKIYPKLSIQTEYLDEVGSAMEEIWLMRSTPREAMDRVAARIQPKLDKAITQWKRVEASRMREWERE